MEGSRTVHSVHLKGINPPSPLPTLQSHTLASDSPLCQTPQLPFQTFTTWRLTRAFCIYFSETALTGSVDRATQITGTLDATRIIDALVALHTNSVSDFLLGISNIFTRGQACGKLLYWLKDLLALKWILGFPTHYPVTDADTDRHSGWQPPCSPSSLLDPPIAILTKTHSYR